MAAEERSIPAQSPAEAVLSGDRLALARLLTQVENDLPVSREALSRLFAHTGRAHLIGVTGSPGTGKSSLVNQLARFYRRPPDGAPAQRVAILAVDPSSPFTGGAVLGDRVRMRDLAGDPGVFIRSMASRGALGGLAHTTGALAQVFDAAGFEVILIETVGAGQAEVDVARLAHTTLVVEAPGLGDDIQAIKAGILEIADILVVNKADRPGVDSTERALRSMIELAYPEAGEFPWKPRILRTVATQGSSIPELAGAIAAHKDYLLSSGEWQRREARRMAAELEDLLRATLVARWRAAVPESRVNETLERLLERKLSPHEAVKYLIENRE